MNDSMVSSNAWARTRMLYAWISQPSWWFLFFEPIFFGLQVLQGLCEVDLELQRCQVVAMWLLPIRHYQLIGNRSFMDSLLDEMLWPPFAKINLKNNTAKAERLTCTRHEATQWKNGRTGWLWLKRHWRRFGKRMFYHFDTLPMLRNQQQKPQTFQHLDKTRSYLLRVCGKAFFFKTTKWLWGLPHKQKCVAMRFSSMRIFNLWKRLLSKPWGRCSSIFRPLPVAQ